MKKRKYPQSLAKHVRRTKAKIRKQTQNKQEQEALIRSFIKELDERRPIK